MMGARIELLFFVMFAGVVWYFVFRMFRYGGFRAAMFAARIDRTLGEVGGEKRGPVGVTLKVHVLRRDPTEKLVGVEFVAKSFASYRMMPITLSTSQAQQLASLLNEAARAP